MELLLNGLWQVVSPPECSGEVTVPGLVTDPAQVNDQPVRYHRTVDLPDGDWNRATLILNGAAQQLVLNMLAEVAK